jgi:hypothetical protein
MTQTQMMLTEIAANDRNTQGALIELFPEFPWGRILGLFDRMHIAEDIIAEGKRQHPDKADEIHDAFQYMVPTPLLIQNDNDELYRAHCRQLIEWVADDQDVNRATDAELLLLMMETSLRVPLTDEGHFLYWYLFRSVFGAEKMRELGIALDEFRYMEKHHGWATADTLETLRDKYGPEHRSCRSR